MPRRVLVERPDASFDLVEVPAPNEHRLQEVMKRNPQLIPSDDLSLSGDLLVIGRETRLASGKIDLLCLARSGELVLVEFKTGPQNPDFRSALAQLLDYGSDLWRLTRAEFERGVVERYLNGGHCDHKFNSASDLASAISLTSWALSAEEASALYDRVDEVLANGDFIYVVASQRFTPAMTTTLDFLNETMRFGRFYLVEIVRLEGSDLIAHAAQVVASPSRKGAGATTSPGGKANLTDFLNGITDDEYREAMGDIFSAAATLGLVTFWGEKGASLRINTRDRDEPLSIGWAFLEGANFQGARHLTLGVNMTALHHRPSAAPAVLKFIDRIRDTPGANPVATKLNAFTFEPASVPHAKTEIIQALEALVDEMEPDPHDA